MKGTSFLLGTSLVALTLLVAQPRTEAGQESVKLNPAQESVKLNSVQLRMIQQATLVPQAVTLTVVAQKFTGSFDTVEKNFDAFKAECIKQKVYDKLAGKAEALLILNEDPTSKGQFSYSIGLTSSSQVAIAAPLTVEVFRLPNTVRTTHVGDYKQLQSVHAEIRTTALRSTAIKKNTSWPVILRLDSNPKYPNIDPRLSGIARTRAMSVLKKEVQTEVLVPLK